MLLVAVAILVLPLVRNGKDPSPLAAGTVVALLPLTAVALYLVFSNWPWGAAPPAAAADTTPPSVEAMVAGLEQRLQTQPDDLQGWLMLGRSYVVMGRFAEGIEAYAAARRLSGDNSAEALTGYAEAAALAGGGELTAEAAGLFERALQLAPGDRKALWYGGLAAAERGDTDIARTRWQKLLDMNPPENMAQLLREQIAALGSGPAAAETGAALLDVSVTLAPSLRDRVSAGAPLFILARPAGAGSGPPLAVVRRQAGDLPLRVELSDADAMMPGHTLSDHKSVEIVARVALGNTPTAQPGDLYGSAISDLSGPVTIEIDSVQ